MVEHPFRGRRNTILVIVGTMIVLAAGVGTASAAVSGSFSSTYNGWDDGADTDNRGNAIEVTGTIEITGDSAVNPRISIRGADYTILDQSSVEVFVEGDRSVNFDRSTRESSVVYRASEIPAGTTLRVEYVTYYTGGADSGNVTVGSVDMDYETPGGSSQSADFAEQNALADRPENVIGERDQQISELEQQQKQGETLSTAQELLSYVGILAVVLVVLKILLSIVRDDDDDGLDI